MKLQNADDRDNDPVTARADFEERVRKYAEQYEPLEDSEGDGQIAYVATR